MAPFFADNFTGTDTTQLQSHTPDTGTSWTRLWSDDATLDFVITSNKTNPETNANSGVVYTADATYPSADYEVQAIWTAASATRVAYLGVRLQDIDNLMGVRLAPGTNLCQLYEKVSGTWGTIGSAVTIASDSVVKVEVIGTTLKLYDDGVEVASGTITITGAGKAWIGAGGGAELVDTTDDAHSTTTFDTLTVTDIPSGTEYTQSAGGTITPSGTIFKDGRKIVAGGITPAGALFRVVSKFFAGTLTPTSALSKLTPKFFDGSLTPSGALAVSRIFAQLVSGSLAPAGTLTKETLKSLAGSLTPAGAMVRETLKTLSGAITPTGSLIRDTFKALIGALAPFGDLSTLFVPGGGTLFFQSADGTLVPLGVLSRLTSKFMSGASAPTGGLSKLTAKSFAGVLPSSGILSTAHLLFVALAGFLTPAGTLTRTANKSVSGALTGTGTIVRATFKLVAGVLVPTGVLQTIGLLSGRVSVYFKGMTRGMFRGHR